MNHHSIRFVLFAAGITALGGFLFGYDTAVINGANSYLAAHLQLTPTQEGLAGASAILGCLPGAMVAGFLSDWLGRRKVLFLCAVLFALSAVLSAVPQTLTQFVVARLIGGVGIGAASMICPVYIAEISPGKWRGRLGTLFQLGIVLGIFITLFINRVVQGLGDEMWNTELGWRWMLGLEVVPAAAFFGLLFAVPESPRWLAGKGRETEAARVLERAGGREHALEEMTAIRAANREEEGRFVELFTGAYRRPLGLALLLAVFQQFCGINAIMYYSTKIFTNAGGGTASAFAASVWVGLINLLFTFVAIGLVDKAGRRPLLLVGTAVQTVALGVVGWMFHAGQQGLPLLLGVVVFIGAFAMAMGPVTWLFCSEVFPNKVRGRAMSLAAFTIWLACYVVAQTFPMLNDSAAVGPAKTFWIYAGVSCVSFLFVLVLVPETKGRTLEEIERLWPRPLIGKQRA